MSARSLASWHHLPLPKMHSSQASEGLGSSFSPAVTPRRLARSSATVTRIPHSGRLIASYCEAWSRINVTELEELFVDAWAGRTPHLLPERGWAEAQLTVFESLLKIRDDDLLHLEHGIHCGEGSLSVRMPQEIPELLGDDLPRKTKLVFEPAALLCRGHR